MQCTCTCTSQLPDCIMISVHTIDHMNAHVNEHVHVCTCTCKLHIMSSLVFT